MQGCISKKPMQTMPFLHYFCVSFLLRKWQNCECNLHWRGVGTFHCLTVTCWHHFVPKATTAWTCCPFPWLDWLSLPILHFTPVLFRTCPKQAPGAGQVDVTPLSELCRCMVTTSLALLTVRRRDWQAFPTHLLSMGFMCFSHAGTSSGLSSPAHTTPSIHISFTKVFLVQAVGGSSMKVRLYTWVWFNQ